MTRHTVGAQDIAVERMSASDPHCRMDLGGSESTGSGGNGSAAVTSRDRPWLVSTAPTRHPPVGRGWWLITAGGEQTRHSMAGPATRGEGRLLTFRKGMTKGRRGKLVASWSLEWNSSMVSVEF